MEHSITKFIAKNLPHQSRYEIDITLLRDGYEPEQIEAAWEQIAPVLVKTSKGQPISKFFISVEVLAFISSLGFLLFVLGPLSVPKFNLPTSNPNATSHELIWMILPIIGCVVLFSWHTTKKDGGYKPFKILVGAYICLILSISAFAIMFFDDLTSERSNFNYIEIDKIALADHSYHLIYVEGCCDAPDYRLELYKCNADSSNCPLIDGDSLYAMHLNEPEKGDYQLAFDEVKGKMNLMNAGQIVYTFRLT